MPTDPTPLRGPAGESSEAGWRIRAQRADELAEVMALSDLAFGAAEGIGALVASLHEHQGLGGRSYVALSEGRIVAHTMLTPAWIDAESRLVPIPVLSPLSVHPDLQGRGLGRAIVGYALAQAEQSGAVGVVLEGDPAFYARLGFEPAEPWGLLRPSVRIPRPAFQWIRLPRHEPWMRGRVVYPDVFWRHDAVGLRGHRGPARSLEVTTVTLGARDLPRLVRFYADLLGRDVPDRDALIDEDWVAVRDEDGAITLAVQLEPEQERVTWPGRTGGQHMQVHLEIRVDDLAEGLEHALTCGATLAGDQPQDDVRVCLDPEGHPFCLWVSGS